MTICNECAKRLGYVPKDKCVGVWIAKCDFCGKKKAVCDSVHDYYQPKKNDSRRRKAPCDRTDN